MIRNLIQIIEVDVVSAAILWSVLVSLLLANDWATLVLFELLSTISACNGGKDYSSGISSSYFISSSQQSNERPVISDVVYFRYLRRSFSTRNTFFLMTFWKRFILDSSFNTSDGFIPTVKLLIRKSSSNHIYGI